MEKTPMNQDFVKGIGVGILAVLALGFVLQNIGGISLNSSSKVLKPTGQVPSANQPTNNLPTTAVAIPDITSDDYIYGNVNAPVTVVEYSDLECPFCATFHPTLKAIVDNSGGNVNWVYRHFPLTQIHPNASKLAEGAECAGKIGGNEAYWKFIDFVFATPPPITDMSSAATAVGVNAATLQSCVNSGEFTAKVQQQSNDAVASGGRGTPYSVIVGPAGETIPLEGAVPQAQIQQVIDSLL